MPKHIPRKNENSNSKRYMHPNVHSSTIYNSKDMETTPKGPSTDDWLKKKKNTHTHPHTHTLEYYSAIKKNGIV